MLAVWCCAQLCFQLLARVGQVVVVCFFGHSAVIMHVAAVVSSVVLYCLVLSMLK